MSLARSTLQISVLSPGCRLFMAILNFAIVIAICSTLTAWVKNTFLPSQNYFLIEKLENTAKKKSAKLKFYFRCANKITRKPSANYKTSWMYDVEIIISRCCAQTWRFIWNVLLFKLLEANEVFKRMFEIWAWLFVFVNFQEMFSFYKQALHICFKMHEKYILLKEM